MAPTISVYTAERHRPNPVFAALPALLALAGLVLIALAGASGWLLALLWTAAVVAYAATWQRAGRRSTRLALGALGLGAAVVLTWEGGLLLVPALLALFVRDRG